MSVSQVGNIFTDTNLDPDYVPSSSGCQSNLSDYFSDEGNKDENSSSDSLILQCLFDNMTFENPEEFEAHQITNHTVDGRFSCGLCEKTYSTKYLQRNHVKGSHLGTKFVCTIQGCRKYFALKRYRDEHERKNHGKSTEILKYVCDICQHVLDTIDQLKEHRLKHSDKKKYICHYCRTRSYTKECDRKNHEENCSTKLASLEKVSIPKSWASKKGSKKIGPKRKLFSTASTQEDSVVSNNPSTISLGLDPSSFFEKEGQAESVLDVPTSRQQPMRNCKNGVSQGFYKNGGSPIVKREQETSSSGESLPPSVKSPKPSLKGKHKCSICKQTFQECSQLIQHAEYQHRTRDWRKLFKCRRCVVNFDSEVEFKVHMDQHTKDDALEVKNFKPYKPPPPSKKKKKK